MCELLQNFSSVHPGLEDDGERLYIFINHTIEVASGCTYSICILNADFVNFLLYKFLRC